MKMTLHEDVRQAEDTTEQSNADLLRKKDTVSGMKYLQVQIASGL